MTPDVNILVAASRADHPHHSVALNWLTENLNETQPPLRLLPMVATGFLRLVTHPKVFPEPTPVDDAIRFLAAILDEAGVEMLELGAEWPRLVAQCAERQLTGNRIPDAWIAAAVVEQRSHLVTFDRGFRKLLKRSQLTVLAA